MIRILNQTSNWALGPPWFGCYKRREGTFRSATMYRSMACSHHHVRGGMAAAALLSASLALSACTGSRTGDMFSMGGLPGWFTSSPSSASTDPTAQASAEPSASMDDDCPAVEVRTGASTLAIATKTQGA